MLSIPSTPRLHRPETVASDSYLPPIVKPRGFIIRLLYWFSRWQFGKVPRPFSVFCARMPTAFARFYGSVSSLDKKLILSPDTASLIRSCVSNANRCQWCMDCTHWYVIHKTPHNAAKLDALRAYQTSPLFIDKERAALNFATELTMDRHFRPDVVEQLAKHYSEREICEIVWLIASEHLYNINNIGLGIGSDGLCAIAG
jgi:alkylhydroperoxidase family enzyme